MKQLICLFVIVLLASFCSTTVITIAATEAVAVTAATTGAIAFETVNGFAIVANAATAAAAAVGPTAGFWGTLALATVSPLLILGGAVAGAHEVLLENHPLYLRDMENFEAFDEDHDDNE